MLKQEQLLVLLVLSYRLIPIKCAMETRIVSGHYARIEDYPHSVFLNMVCEQTWICGASILNQQLLITAGHCVFHCDFHRPGHRIEAFLGSDNIKKAQVRRVAHDFIVHEEYNDDSIENDIAIVKVEVAFTFGKTIKRVLIRKVWPHRSDPAFGYVAGWGMINDTVPIRSMKLMSINQKMRSHELCDRILGPLMPGMFCAGSTVADDPHAAQGDSGSALMYQNIYQIGLVSFKVRAYPALMVYTNLTYYYKWIKVNALVLYCRSK